MRHVKWAILTVTGMALASTPFAWSQEAQLRTAGEVLERYQQALGGVDAIQRVQSETVRGEVESTNFQGKATFIYQAKPFKTRMQVSRPDGSKRTFGFDGNTSWAITAEGTSIDKDTPLEAVRRDADLQYALHQPDYFQKLELAGIAAFDGRPCYWLHGTTHWGKDNNQFYDVRTGLLAGYRFQSDDKSAAISIVLFQDYKNFGGPLVATKVTSRTGKDSQTFTYKSISYEPIPDSIFELPQSVKALLN
ncbi:MAG TPA: hypothetical protein VLW84_02080 [Terriglobales bacterium]|nr:hypothetical protein [Terriglobales bacterium]